MRVALFVPLKTSSRRVPSKNFRPFAGRPSLADIVATKARDLVHMGAVTEAYVLTAEDEVAKRVPLTPLVLPEMAAETSAGAKVRLFAEHVEADLYVELFATAPFLSLASIAACINAIGGHRSATPVRAVHGYWWYRGLPSYSLNKTPGSDSTLPLLIETTGCYVFDQETALAETRLADPVYFHRVDYPEWIDIDTETDWSMAESVYRGGW